MPGVRAGDLIPISLKLPDSNPNMFVRAVLRNADGIALPQSPVVLAHIGDGRYEDNTVPMPNNTAYVSASFGVFDDNLFTIPSALYGDGDEIFELVVPDYVILATLNEIRDMLLVSGAGGSNSTITAVIQKVDELIAHVEEANYVSAIIDEEQSVTAIIDDEEELVGVIDEDDNVTSELE